MKGRVRELEDENPVLRGESERLLGERGGLGGSGCWVWWMTDDTNSEDDGGVDLRVRIMIVKEEWEDTQDEIEKLRLELEGWKRGYEDLRDGAGVEGNGVVMLRKEDFEKRFEVGRLRSVGVDGLEGLEEKEGSLELEGQ